MNQHHYLVFTLPIVHSHERYPQLGINVLYDGNLLLSVCAALHFGVSWLAVPTYMMLSICKSLLYADDAVIFAENEELMRRGLDVLAEWCTEWSVKVNVEKCGVMHMRKKGVKRSDGGFLVGGEVIKVVEEYKYLGCVVDEHLSNVRMIEERAKAGAKALSDWLRRCRASVGEVRGATFVRLLEMLVESVQYVIVWGRGMGMWRAA